MSVTYTYPSISNKDAVRWLVGDTNVTDAELQDEEIAFALTQSSNDVYGAAAICARALAAKYASLVDTKFEDVSSDYSNLRENYLSLAVRLDKQSKKYGSKGLGMPYAGGLTYSDIRANEEDPDRVDSKFKQDQFANPPRGFEGEKYGY